MLLRDVDERAEGHEKEGDHSLPGKQCVADPAVVRREHDRGSIINDREGRWERQR